MKTEDHTENIEDVEKASGRKVSYGNTIGTVNSQKKDLQPLINVTGNDGNVEKVKRKLKKINNWEVGLEASTL